MLYVCFGGGRHCGQVGGPTNVVLNALFEL